MRGHPAWGRDTWWQLSSLPACGGAGRGRQACVPDGGCREHLPLGAHTEDDHGGHHHDEVCGGGAARRDPGQPGALATRRLLGKGLATQAEWTLLGRGASSAGAGEAVSTPGTLAPARAHRGRRGRSLGPGSGHRGWLSHCQAMPGGSQEAAKGKPVSSLTWWCDQVGGHLAGVVTCLSQVAEWQDLGPWRTLGVAAIGWFLARSVWGGRTHR